LAMIARGAGIAGAVTIENTESFTAAYSRFLSEHGPVVIVCKIEPVYIRGDGPNFNGQENKFRLVRQIEETEGIKILQGPK
jgi:thiamine pyrophosphate-dependent acetolactate synthase large subunit-like protein